MGHSMPVTTYSFPNSVKRHAENRAIWKLKLFMGQHLKIWNISWPIRHLSHLYGWAVGLLKHETRFLCSSTILGSPTILGNPKLVITQLFKPLETRNSPQ